MSNEEKDMTNEQDDSGIEQDQQWIFIRISIEDYHLQKVFKFNFDDTIWSAKLKILQLLVKELNDELNYGLYLPPSNGRAGKFLDESRCLKEYPLNGPVSYLELKYKRRVYKSLNLLEKNIRLKVHPKKFLDAVKTNQIAKVTRYLDKGFDPNFHISDDETPLIVACIELFEPRSMIMTLVNGGAHLDFRTRRGGLTPLHKSAMFSRKEAIVTLLELGASPNVYDEKNLTPLYHSIITNENEFHVDSSYCCLLLLQDHSIVNCCDESLLTELHQSCRLGLVQHVEHLLFYRCDINAINQSGNTPLHICATTNQEGCARVLLFRGADITIVNKLNRSAYELALLSGNHSIATLIQSHKTEHIVPFREIPLINPKRRSIYIEQYGNTHRTRSSSVNSQSQNMPKLNPLRRSQSPLTTSNHIENYFHQQQQQQQHHHPSSRSSSPKSFSVNSDQGFASESNSHLSTGSPNCINGSYTCKRKRLYAAAPGRKCMCVKSYRTNLAGELLLNKGDIVEILSVGEQGYLEGRCKDNEGWFPSNHVQDICVFKNSEVSHDDTIVISRDALSALMINNDAFTPRTIVLQKGRKGFGFVLRGSRIAGKLFQPTPSFPALQFLDSIEKGSNADKAGLKQNDYVLQINGINVISMPHEECVQLIKRAGDTLALKVVTANPVSTNHSHSNEQNLSSQSLPYRRKASLRAGLDQQFNVYRSSSKLLNRKNPFENLFDQSQMRSLIIERKNSNQFLDVDRTIGEYEYGCLMIQSSMNVEEYSSISKQTYDNHSKMKPLIPERDSSLYECFPSTQTQQIYNTFRPLNRLSSSIITTNISNHRHNSNSSSNEADEESSLSSLNSNHLPNSNEENLSMSTFKTNVLPSKPSEIKRRSNHRKQIYTTLYANSNNNNNIFPSSMINENETNISPTPPPPPLPPPPPPPPFPTDFHSEKKCQNEISLKSNFQSEIEQARNRLKKVSNEVKCSSSENELRDIGMEDKTCSITTSNGFPPPPSPTTLRRSNISSIKSTTSQNSPSMDPRLDVNFSAVIAQRAAEAKARRIENPSGLEFNSHGLPPSTTFFNNCVTTNGNSLSNSVSHSQRFSTTANQLLENLKRRGGTTTSIHSLVKHYNQQSTLIEKN